MTKYAASSSKFDVKNQNHAKSCGIMSSHVELKDVESCQVMSSLVRSCKVICSHVESCRVMSCQVMSSHVE